jgi:hypothetical protein
MGLAGAGISSWLLYKGYFYIKDSFNNSSKELVTAPSRKILTVPFRFVANGLTLIGRGFINAPPILQTTISTLFAGGMLVLKLIYLKETYNAISRTTKCCHIVRSTAFYSVMGSVCTLGILFWSWVAIGTYYKKHLYEIMDDMEHVVTRTYRQE